MLWHMCWLLFVFPTLLPAQHKEIGRIKSQLPHIGDSVTYVDALNRLAAVYQACQLDSCGRYASMARDMAVRIGYASGKARALRNLGNYYALRPHRYLSYLFYNDALDESRKAGDSVNVSQVLMNIGIYHYFTGKFASANEYVTQSLKLTHELKEDSLHALGLGNYYAINYTDSSNLTAATRALQEATTLAERYRDIRELLYIRLLLANEDYLAERFEAAKQRVRQVLDTAIREGFEYYAMRASMELSEYKSRLREPDSLVYLQDAVTHAVTGGYVGLLLPQVTQLYHYFQQKKDTLQAARYSRIALNIMQQQQDDMQQGEMDYIAYSLQDQTLDSLKMQSDLQKTALQKTRLAQRYWQYLFIFVVAIIMLLMVLTWFLLRSYRSSRLRSVRLARVKTEIVAANEVLKKNDDFKNKLISLIAHDFRTPLYNIIDITGFVNEDILTPEDAAGMVMEVEQTATATLTVFEEILSWMRTQLSGFVYRPHSFVLTDMLEVSARNVQHLLREKNIRLELRIPSGLTVQGDFEMLQFVHRNFLHNAIKFSPENSTITIMAIRKNGYVEVFFRDQGPGIDPVVLPGLFTYDSESYAHQRTGKGAGLALIICRDFIDKMNGDAGAVNNDHGGSTFFYRVPEIDV